MFLIGFYRLFSLELILQRIYYLLNYFFFDCFIVDFKIDGMIINF